MIEESIGSKIRRIRKENKDSLKSLSEKINYDYSNLSKVELGKYEASVELLEKIINIYNLDASYFFDNEYTKSEREILLDQNLHIPDLKEKYNFVIDGVEATDDEIKEAIKLIRYLRSNE